MSHIFKAAGGPTGKGPTEKGLSGTLSLPGDKSISHRALILACLAEGTSKISGLANGADVAYTLKAVQALGAKAEPEFKADKSKVNSSILIRAKKLTEPKKPIYVGNSGTGIRLLTGVCAGQNFTTRLDGDKSIRSRPMNRIVEPLTQMGAQIKTKNGYAPLLISAAKLTGIEYELPIASAQVKSAILLAGLFAEGTTRVIEKIPARAHTEEMLEYLGAEIKRFKNSEGGQEIEIQPCRLFARDIEIPGDPSAAAFWAVAATIIPGSSIELNNVYLGTARSGWLDVLKRMGADIEIAGKEIKAGKEITGPEIKSGKAHNKQARNKQTPEEESNAYDIHIKSAELSGTLIAAEEIPGLIDEIPILCIAAAHAKGTTKFFEIGELRHKESNRILALEHAFNALGGDLRVLEDVMEIKGTQGFSAKGKVKINSHGDHRIAMAFAIAALAGNKSASLEISIKKFNSTVATSYPDFLRDLTALQS